MRIRRLRWKIVNSIAILMVLGFFGLLMQRLNDGNEAEGDWPGRNEMNPEVFKRDSKHAKIKPDVVVDESQLPRKDWNDYDKIRIMKARTGPGEQGVKVILTPEMKQTEREDTRENGFNERVCNMVSLDRAVPDIRDPFCQKVKYMVNLPSTSVVIPFHNEALSALKRTVHSVLNMSPPELIHEIILVDDWSDRAYLKEELEEYMKTIPKVSIYRTAKREGLIRTRLLGARHATGDVLLFLDSHCEANYNWLPPLLERIALNRKRIVCPMIDVISNEDFHYESQAGDVMRGAFDWELYYKRIPINDGEMRRRQHKSEAFRTPIMAGGLFAVDRKYFMDELGGYDEGLEVWGGEQYDLSFKVWMCGGEMEEVPCSRVGHIYRKFMSYSVPGGASVINKNLLRVVEVWMDDWKKHFYTRRPHLKGSDFGDISKQLALRERLQCKNFTWFMTEIAPDILQYYPPVEPDPRASGPIKNKESGLCLAIVQGSRVDFILDECNYRFMEQGGKQHFILTWHDDVRWRNSNSKDCWDFSSYREGEQPILYPCHHGGGNQLFLYHPDTKHIYQPISHMCLAAENTKSNGRTIAVMQRCQAESETQQWDWDVKDAKKLNQLISNHQIVFAR